MGSTNAEILARLTLNGEEFSSELAKRLGSVTAAGERAATDLKRPFISAFSEVQAMAAKALELPRTQGGSLNLSAEIASLKGSANAAEQRAAALREMSAAQLAAAASVSDGAEQLRIEADAARVAAQVEDDLVRSLRSRVVAMEAVQTELNRTHSAVDVNTRASNDNEKSQRAMRFAMQQTSYSVQDLMTQASMGGNVLQAFTVQGMQAAGAFTQVGGKVGAAANVLMGPWGLALSGGLLLLAPYVDKLFDGGEASEKLKDKSLTLADALTKEAIGTEAAQKALVDYNAEKERGRKNDAAALEDTLRSAEARLKEALATRTQTEQLIQQAIVEFDIAKRRAQAPGQRGELAAITAGNAAQNVAGLESRLADNQSKINDIEASIRNLRVEVGDRNAKGATDKIASINQDFDRRLLLLKNEAKANNELAKSYESNRIALEKLRDSEVKAEQDRQRKANQKPRMTGLGDQIENERGQHLLSSAQGYLGAREDTTSGRSTLGTLFREANVRVDPKMTAWCAAFVNAVLATNGLPGTNSLSARSFLGYGSSTDKPQKGDIVVLRRGDSAAQGHVGFYAGEGRNGNVLVTGGNQGNSVSTQSFRRSDVLGFRRAPSAADSFADEERQREAAAEQARRSAEAFRSSVQSLTEAFDPAQAATDRYNKTLLEIVAASTAGYITGDQAARFMSGASTRYQAESSRISRDDAVRSVGGEGEFAAGIDAWEEAMRAANDNAARRVAEIDDRLSRAGDAFEQSIAGAADLFGIRVTGPMQLMFGRGGVDGLSKDIAADMAATLRGVGVKLSDDAEKRIASAISGAAFGQMGGSIFASITGGKDNKLASSLGGVVGNELGKEAGKLVAKEVGGKLGGMLGNLGGPLGSILGGIAGSALSSLFQKAPKGQAGVTVNQYGTVQAGAATGTDAQATAGASTMAGAVSSGLNRIAELLGAKVTGSSDVQIGVYKDMIRVNSNGGAIGGVKGSGALTFQTEEAAIAYAISDALKDGVLSGISDASLKILRSGQDLEKAISKAIMIEQLPKQLKAAIDPVGAAVDTVREKFAKIVAALEEGGASAEQRAQAERLYNIELEQAKVNAPAAAQTLKDFLAQLKVGGNSPLSLREQSEAAKATLNPYLTAIEAGQAIDQGKFRDAAQSYLDVQRQLFGSTRQYFEAFDAVQAATNKAIAKVENASGINTPAVPDPFTKATAAAAEAMARAAETGNEIASDQTDLMQRLVSLGEQNAALLARLAENAGGGDFMGALRGYGNLA